MVALRRKDDAAAAVRYQDYTTRLVADVDAAGQSAKSRAELGGALREAGLLREAETELLAAANLEPGNPDTVVGLARVHLARKDIAAAGRTLEGAVARGLDSAPIYALLAEVYEQSGHPENAIPAMRLAIQRDPQSENYRFAYGLLLTNSYAPAAAVIRLKEALDSFPTSPRLLFALGMAHFKQNKNDEAAEFFRRAAEIDPKFAPAFAYLGMTRVALGSYGEGIAYYERALQVDPQLAVVHYLIADTMLKQPDANHSLIESHLQRGVEMDPTFA
ncbi:MAG: tetratricopeptide repeat protein, partial [Acidobacteriota bacterium]|nr:tetratricopeptide repeat protein [Acidobacteriota bacterium]